jgi:hypothetical protein
VENIKPAVKMLNIKKPGALGPAKGGDKKLPFFRLGACIKAASLIKKIVV